MNHKRGHIYGRPHKRSLAQSLIAPWEGWRLNRDRQLEFVGFPVSTRGHILESHTEKSAGQDVKVIDKYEIDGVVVLE